MATDSLDVRLQGLAYELYQIESAHALLFAILFEPLRSLAYLWYAADTRANGRILVLPVRDVTGG